MLKKIKNNEFGFTLIELLTSIFIVTLISGVFMANYHAANERNKLNLAIQELASNIRIAQNYALGSKEFNGNIPNGGWGINFISNAGDYTIFADDGSISLNIGEALQTINLPNGINFNNLFSNCEGATGGQVTMTFVPPDPITEFNADFDTSNGRVCVSLIDASGRIKTVEINKFGLIDVY